MPVPSPLMEDLATAQHTFTNLLGHITPADLAKPTVNDGWTVKEVINHVIDGDHWAATCLRTGKDEFSDTDYIADRPATDAVRTAQQAFMEALDESSRTSSPEGRMSAADLVAIRIDELIGHGWDIAQATGQNTDLCPDVAVRSLERLRETLITPESRGEFFKPAQPFEANAPAADRLAAFAGKHIASAYSPQRSHVFVNGENGYACYRIPGIVRTGPTSLLAVAEARRDNCGDHGGIIRVVAKFSTDNGVTWSPLIEVARNILSDGSEHVAQNPAPVVDWLDPARPNGKVFLIFNKAEAGERETAAGGAVRRIFVTESHDLGQTWTNERDITTDVHRPLRPQYTRVHPDAATRYNHPDDWRATFPPVGHAIQLRGGIANRPETRGRIYVTAYTTIGSASIFEGQNYAIWSDDHGATWGHCDPSPVVGPNEAMAVELEDGSVLVNFRNYTNDSATADPVRGQMIHTFDANGAIRLATTHTEPPELTMSAPGLQGSIHRLAWSDDPDGDGVSHILFSGADHLTQRVGMTVWLSEDEGRTWPVRKLIDPGPSAYSDLVDLADGRIGLLYELGGTNGIDFVTFSLDWLTS